MWALTAKEMKDCCWLKPKLVAQVEFTEWTPDGHLRHSSFAGLRDDKDARKIQRGSIVYKRLTPAHTFLSST
jgi:bifunctional non-homologous end joining protein LigD